MANRKRTNNDLQNLTQNTKDGATRTPLETGGVLRKVKFVEKLNDGRRI